MGLIQKIKNKNMSWVHITNPNPGSIEYLRQNYKFNPIDLETCLGPTTRSVLSEYENYLFMVLNFPIFDRNSRTISLSELDIFIGADFIVTINNKKLEPLTKIFESCQVSDAQKEKYLGDDTTFLLKKIIDELQNYCFPILDHVSQDMTDIEDKIFEHKEKILVKDILLVKRNIVNIRKSLQSHKNLIKNLEKMSYKDFLKNDLKSYFADILDQSKEIWEILENQKETIEALHNTNESLISFKLNSIMKMLTIISVTLMPLTLVSSTFGMNYIIPFQGKPFGFYFALSLMFIFTLVILSIFKGKKWLD